MNIIHLNLSTESKMYDVYQYFPYIGKYGENHRVATFNDIEQAKAKVERAYHRNITMHIIERPVSMPFFKNLDDVSGEYYREV
mgnify:FL=1